jgi:hypothetical protein
MRALLGESRHGRHRSGLWQSDAIALPVPHPGRVVSGDEPDARATEPPAPLCDRCRGAMAFVMTIFQTQVFECTQCKKGMLIPEPPDDE